MNFVDTTKKISLIIFGILLALIISEGFFQTIESDSIHYVYSHFFSQKKEYRILVIGESCSAGDESWPKYLEDILNEGKLPYKFIVFNEAIPGTNTAYIASRIKDHLRYYHPDLVISMMGGAEEPIAIIYNESQDEFDFNKYRIYRLLIDSLKRGIQIKKDNEKSKFSITQNKSHNLVLAGDKQFLNHRFDDAKGSYTEALQLDPINSQAYMGLGNIYFFLEKFRQAEEMYKKSILIKEGDAYHPLGELYFTIGDYTNAEKMFEKSLHSNYPLDNSIWDINYILAINAGKFGLNNEGKFKDISTYRNIVNLYLLKKQGFQYKEVNDSMEITKYHYNYINGLLKKKKILYFAAQYPTLNIEVTKNLLDDKKEVVFISNKELFEKAMEEHAYQVLFEDKVGNFLSGEFRGEWGHLSKLGHKMIAEHIASVLVKELNVSSDN